MRSRGFEQKIGNTQKTQLFTALFPTFNKIIARATTATATAITI